MTTVEKYLYLAPLLFFLTTSLPLQHLWAAEALKKHSPDQLKTESRQEKTSSQNQPQIHIDSITYNAGEIYEGDIIVHTFTVKNVGTAQLNINKVGAG